MTKLRPLRERERTLIKRYIYCQLEMTPQQFQAKWEVNHEELALICSRSLSTVRRWFIRGRYSAGGRKLTFARGLFFSCVRSLW